MKSQTEKQHIAIVGGGMVGISLALVLSHSLAKELLQGLVSITLIEQFALNASAIKQPSFDDRSTALSAGTADLLAKINCWSELEPYVEKINSVHVSDRGHFSGTHLKAEAYALDAVGYVAENKQLGRALVEQLRSQDINCLAPATVKQCLPKKGGYELSIEYHEEQQSQNVVLNADLLLVADGADSPLRKKLGIATEIMDYRQSALIANIALSRPHGGIAYERFTDEGPIALLPLSTLDGVHRAALVWTLPEEKSQQLSLSNAENFLEQLQQRFGYRVGKMTGVGQRQTYPLQLIKAQEQVRSHLVIVGNAAHFLHPVAGQGFNLALRDCWVLGECLQEASMKGLRLGDYSILKTYTERQSADQAVTMALTDGLVRLFSSSLLPKVALRQLGLMSLNFFPAAKKQFAQKMMGLSL